MLQALLSQQTELNVLGLGRFRPTSLAKVPLGQNPPQEVIVPQVEANPHFIGRFVAAALSSLRSYRQSITEYIFEPSPRFASPDYESRVVAAPSESRVVAVPFESRVVSVPAENRVVAVIFENRIVAVSTNILAGQAMPVVWPNKDPGEIADYDLDWPPRLGIIDTIVSSLWAIIGTDSPTGTPIAIQSSSFIATRTKVWLSAGNLGFTYSLQNTVVTANGDTLIQTAKVLIKKK